MNNPFEVIEARLSSIENLILDLKHQPKQVESSEQPQRWFDLTEFCNYIPDKPSKPTVYGWVHKGVVPNHRRGKKLYFLKSEIDTWLRSGKRKSNAEIEDEADSYLSNKNKGLK